MQPLITIRKFKIGDENHLRAVFYSSVHELACDYYNKAQLAVWASIEYDEEKWKNQLLLLQPFVAEINGKIAGYADLQNSGYIDHFFIAGLYAGQGVARALMQEIHKSADNRKINKLSADVSLSAEKFFQKSGFIIESYQKVERKGLSFDNLHMSKILSISS